MALEKGSGGVITAGGAVVGRITSYTFDTTAALERLRFTGTAGPEFLPTGEESAGQIECTVEAGDVGQAALTPGAIVTLIMQRDGVGSGNPQASVTAAVGTVNEPLNADEYNKISFGWQGGPVDRTPQA